MVVHGQTVEEKHAADGGECSDSKIVSSYATGNANIGLNSGLPPTMSGIVHRAGEVDHGHPGDETDQCPPTREKRGTLDRRTPIAPSRPCTGHGVMQSQILKPASRTFSAAW